MTKIQWLRKRLAVGLIFAGIIGVCATAYAADGTGSADMTVLKELSVTKATGGDVALGDVNRPSSGDFQFKLATDGTVTDISGGATDGFHAGGTTSAGQFAIAGEANQAVLVEVAYTAFADTNITINTAYIDSDQSTMSANNISGTLDINGDLTVHIGADVTVTPAVALGAHSTTVTVTANYQ